MYGGHWGHQSEGVWMVWLRGLDGIRAGWIWGSVVFLVSCWSGLPALFMVAWHKGGG